MMVVGKWKSCTECGKKLSSYHSLWRHKKTIHGNNDRSGGGGNNRKTDRQSEPYPSRVQPCDNPPSRDHRSMWKRPRCDVKGRLSDNQQSADGISSYVWRGGSSIESSDERSLDEMSDGNSDTFDPHAKADIATYAWRGDGSTKKNHCSLLPRNVRAIIVGKSGCGKTTFVTSLLLEPDMMDYNKLMMCGRSLHQPEYEVMRTGFDKGLSKNQVRTLFRKQDEIMEDGGVDNALSTVDICKGGIDASFFNDMNMIPDPTEHDTSQRNLLVLDDVMLGPQNKVEAYFTRGRHNNVDVIYIAQSYFRLPRQTIRENANLFIFFAQDGKNLVHIFHDHCSGDGISFDLFSAMCNDWWRQGKHNFITIDLSKPVNDGKYRKNFNLIWAYK